MSHPRPASTATLLAPGFVLALHGPSGVGKDWLAQSVLANHGFVAEGLAAEMKAALVADLVRDQGMAPENAYEAVFVTRTPAIRTLLLGGRTERLRATHGVDIFLRAALIHIGHLQRSHSPIPKVVITDVRAHAEVALLQEAGATVAHVTADESDALTDLGAVRGHTIEAQGRLRPPYCPILRNNRKDPSLALSDLVSLWPRPLTKETPPFLRLPALRMYPWAMELAASDATLAQLGATLDAYHAGVETAIAHADAALARMLEREGEVWALAYADARAKDRRARTRRTSTGARAR